jgi:ATP-dependent Lhr-like helicase
VIEFPSETFVGTVHEDFAIESLAGDIFLLGNRSWRIRRVATGKVWVKTPRGCRRPFHFGWGKHRREHLNFPGRLGIARRRAGRLVDRSAAAQWLIDEVSMPPAAAEQIVGYVADTMAVLGTVPSQGKIIAERFFDEPAASN